MTLPLTTSHLLWRMHSVHVESVVEDLVIRSIEQRSLTFPEVAERATHLGAGLTSHYGLARGDVVSVLAFNTRSHLELILGVPAAGLVLESLNVRLGADTLQWQLHRSDAAVVLVDAEVLEHNVVGSTASRVIDDARKRGLRVLVFDSRLPASLDELLRSDVSTGCHQPGESDTAFRFHTSGTTGRPKSYRVSHRDAVLHALSQATTVGMGLRSDDRVLPIAPFFHVNGWGVPLVSAITGSDLILPGADVSPAAIVSALRDRRVTVAAAVPTIWFDVCEHLRATVPQVAASEFALREVITGGSAVSASIVSSVRDRLGANLACAWGMTETMACSTYERLEPQSRVGKPVPLIETRVSTDGSHRLSGHLEVRGSFIVGGKTSEGGPTGVNSDGWLDTDDIASVSSSGQLRLHDRAHDRIKSGGEWIDSVEIEKCLLDHPGVTAAAVVAQNDERWSERPVAYVVLRDQAVKDQDVSQILTRHLSESFPRWWLPDAFHVVGQLPVTVAGKVDKASLRRALVDESEPVPRDTDYTITSEGTAYGRRQPGRFNTNE